MNTKNLPLYSLITMVVLIVAAVLLVLFAPSDKQGYSVLIGLIVSTIPSVIASVYSERASKDIRNGVVEEKAKIGATAAIEETQVITRNGPAVETSLAALARLLEVNTAANRANTAARNDEGRESNG